MDHGLKCKKKKKKKKTKNLFEKKKKKKKKNYKILRKKKKDQIFMGVNLGLANNFSDMDTKSVGNKIF